MAVLQTKSALDHSCAPPLLFLMLL